jgi:tetrapyrrole methylase family protein/MazG family protein
VDRAVDPARPLVVGAVEGPAAELAAGALSALYGPGHSVRVVRFPLRSDRPAIIPLHLDQLGAALGQDEPAWLYVPPLERLDDVEAFDTLAYIVGRLRGPGGCPWDREQTFDSIKKHLIEETYEAVDALDRAAYRTFAEELGDVLLQVVMYAQLGREAGAFDLRRILRAVNEKLVRRHPHVFGDLRVSGPDEVLRNWERIKRGEARGPAAPASTFGGVPTAAPALLRTDAVQSRAARYGWPPPTDLPDLSALARPDLDSAGRRRALGDALFDLVATARRQHLDPEEALRLAKNRFVAAFDLVSVECRERGESYETLPPDERRRRLDRALGQA